MNNYDHADNLNLEEDAKLHRAYNEYFDSVKPSEELIAAALSNANRAPSQKTPHKKRLLPYAAAACLVLAIFGLGAYGLATNQQPASSDNPKETTSNEENANSGTSLGWPAFTVQAFAEETQSLITPTKDGTVVFSRQDDALFLGTDYETSGFYTGCIFTVRAEDAVRIQAHVSNGMLYQYTSETLSSADSANAEKLAEAKSWKPLVRGKGSYYGGYDLVSVSSGNITGDAYTVGASKRLGQTVDLDITGGQQVYLGLWTDASSAGGASENEASLSFDALIQSFEGATLTLTLTYDDGHTATETLELHVIADENSSLNTLAATLIDESGEAFPYANEPTNEYANVVTDAETLAKLSDWGEPTENVTIASEGEVSLAIFRVSDIAAATAKALPDGLTLASTDISNMGDLDYWNLICSQTNGFTIDESGAPSDGWSIFAVSFTLTNTGDTLQEFNPLAQVQLGKAEGGTFQWLMGGARSYYWTAELSDNTTDGNGNAASGASKSGDSAGGNDGGASSSDESSTSAGSPSSTLSLAAGQTARVNVGFIAKDGCLATNGLGIEFAENEGSDGGNYLFVQL